MPATLLSSLLYIGLGGALGAMARYGCMMFLIHYMAIHKAHWATLIVNGAGSFLLGACAAYFLTKNAENESLKLFLSIGLIGGFTTFSTFSLENLELIQNEQYISALLYMIISVILGLSFCAAGFTLVKLTS